MTPEEMKKYLKQLEEEADHANQAAESDWWNESSCSIGYEEDDWGNSTC